MLAAGIADGTMSQWRKIAAGDDTWQGSDSPVKPDTKDRILTFLKRLAQTQADCMQTLVGSLYANATTANEKTGWFDTQAADRLLSKHPTFRQEWYENKHQTIDQLVTHRREDSLAESSTEAELEAWSALALPDPSSP